MSIRRVYETTIIINVAMGEQEIESVVDKVSNYIRNHGGDIEETNKWGNRRLAYPIDKKHYGYYMHIVYNIQPAEVPSIERFLVLDDAVLRHLTLQLTPDLREFRKQKSLAEGKSGETLITSVTEIEKIEPVKEIDAPSKDEAAPAESEGLPPTKGEDAPPAEGENNNDSADSPAELAPL